VVYVPNVQRHTPPASPAHLNAQRYTPDYERTVEATLARLREPLDHPTASYAREPEITTVELSAGPACRIHQVLVAYSESGDQVTMENVEHYVLPEAYSEDMLLLRTFWVKDSVPGMVELADRIAATLTFVPRGSGEETPRPVLDVPQHVVFDEVQIGKGLRPLAQHGFVTIDNGVLSLLGTDRQLIDSAPLPEITAWPIRASFSTAVGLEINGAKYNAAPGRGSYPKAFTLPTDLMKGASVADQLLTLIENNGGKRR
jgi:hypothetical protein